jgi:hypothetical protein
MMNRRVRELVLISLLAALCGGLAWTHDQPLFAAAFAAAAVVAGTESRLLRVLPKARWCMKHNGLVSNSKADSGQSGA